MQILQSEGSISDLLHPDRKNITVHVAETRDGDAITNETLKIETSSFKYHNDIFDIAILSIFAKKLLRSSPRVIAMRLAWEQSYRSKRGSCTTTISQLRAPLCYPELGLISFQFNSTASIRNLRLDYFHASLFCADTRNLCSGLHHCEVGFSYSPVRTCHLRVGSRCRRSNRQRIRTTLRHILHLHHTASLSRLERNRFTPSSCSARYIRAGGVATEGLLLDEVWNLSCDTWEGWQYDKWRWLTACFLAEWYTTLIVARCYYRMAQFGLGFVRRDCPGRCGGLWIARSRNIILVNMLKFRITSKGQKCR